MSGPTRWLDRLGLRHPRPAESVAWEIEHHLAELVDQLVAEGMEPEAARAEAARRFGDAGRYAPRMRRDERARLTIDRWAGRWDVVRQSFVSAARTTRREPGFVLGVVLTLGLGIGANATMYGIVDRLLLSAPEHIVEPGQVRRLFANSLGARSGEVIFTEFSVPDYEALAFARGMDVAAYQEDYERTIGSGSTAMRAKTVLASAELFPLLGVTPRLGRFFRPEEATVGASLTVVLSEEFWRRAYGADPAILGRVLEINGHAVPVVGVAPRGFTGVDLQPVDIWLPLLAWASLQPNECLSSYRCYGLSAVARLADGVSEATAAGEATQLTADAWAEAGSPTRNALRDVSFAPLIAEHGANRSAEARVAMWLGGVSLIVLLVACANVTNLLLARGARERRNRAVRRALGVSRSRLVTQVVMDTVPLALAGGAVALVLAAWGGQLIRSMLLPGVVLGSAVSWHVVVYASVAALVAGLLASIGPALVATRNDVESDLASGARAHTESRSRLRGLLTVSQAAMCAVLLVGAGLFVRSLVALRNQDLGLDADRLILVDFEFTSSEPDPAVVRETYASAARMLRSLPEVAAVATSGTPFGWTLGLHSIRVPGTDSLPTAMGWPAVVSVGPGYFETVGMTLLSGREIDERDVAGAAPVTVVSERTAELLWPGNRAVGQCLIVDRRREACTTVVGVVEDAALGSIEEEPHMAFYFSMEQVAEIAPDVRNVAAPSGIYVRPSDLEETQTAVARALAGTSPQVRWTRVMPIQDTLNRQARSWTLGATVFTIFGLLALVVAAIGLYSVLAFDVAQRTREIGIRAVLGARSGRLLATVVSQGVSLGAVGILVGLGVAYVAAPYAQGLLFETSPRDPWVLGGVGGLLVAVSVLASLIPGLRATRVDPMVALKSD